MKKNVKSSLIMMFSVLIAMSSMLLCMQAFDIKLPKKYAYAVSNGTDLIEAGQGMRVEGNYSPKANEISGFTDPRTGVLLSTNTQGATAKFKNEMTGDFHLDYRMLSYGSVRDINQLSFTFKDSVTKRFFEVRLICQNSAGWYNTKVFVDGQTVGYGVRSDAGEASAVSSQGTYGLASFGSKEATLTNTAVTADQPIGEDHTTGRVGNQLLFNPNTMEVRVNSTGSRNALKLVMDLDSEEHMEKIGEPMQPFGKYTVEVKVVEFLGKDVDSTSSENGAAGSEKRPGKVLMYALNGQSLAGKTITDNAGAVLNTPTSKGVVGEPYSIKGITGYDVKDGLISYQEGKFKVYDKDNKECVLTNGAFTPASAGKYYVTHTDSNKNASVSSFTYGSLESNFYTMRIEEIVMAGQPLRKYSDRAIITVLDAREEVTFKGQDTLEKLIENYPSRKLPAGKKIEIPLVSARDAMGETMDDHGYMVGNSKCSVGVKIKKGSETVLDKNEYTGIEQITLAEGSYTVTYTANNQFGKIGSIDVSFTAAKDVPLIVIPDGMRTYVEINGVYQIPAATATVNETKISVITCVKSPKGREEENITEAYTFDEFGTYTITYKANYNGITFTETRVIFVATKAENLIENIRASELEFGADSPSYAEAKNGVKVTATRGNAAIRYKNVIDLSKATQTDTLLQFMMLPQVRGAFDFSVLKVKLTDIHNSNNYIEIAIKRNNSPDYKYTSFISAGTNGNPLRGINVNGEVKEYNQQTSVCPTGFYGFGFAIGDTLEEGVETLFGNLHYENATRQIWLTKGREGSARSLVLDLDNTAHVGAGNEWDGFTTGEVYMTIQAEDLSKSTASYMISMINNQSLAGEYIKSEVESRIVVDMAGNGEIPVGIVGKSYRIFDAYAYNQVDGKLATGFNVQLNGADYPMNGQTFTPSAAGVYSIIYTLNNLERIIDVEVKNASDVAALDFKFKEENNIVSKAYVGEYVFIPTGGIVSGGSGNKKVEYTVKIGDKNVTIDSGGKFKVVESGTYSLTVKITDYLGQTKDFVYNIAVSYSKDPIFERISSVPNVILQDKEYIFPEFMAVQYIEGQASHTANIVVSIVTENGQEIALSDGKYTPLAAHGKKITLIYKAERKDGSASGAILEYEINILNPYDGLFADRTKFFYTDNAQSVITADMNNVKFSSSGDVTYSYATMLPAHNFNMEFTLLSKKANFETLQIIMRDSLDSNQEVRFNIQKNSESNSYLYINNETRRNIIGGSFGTTANVANDIMFKFIYVDAIRALTNDIGKTIARIETTAFGDEFSGFTSGKIYLEFKFIGVTSESEMQISSICSQLFNNATIDRKSPSIQIYGAFPKDPMINDDIVIPRADAIDVLDPNSTITLTVKSPDKKTILNGVDIGSDITLKLTQYGRYEITYTAKDASNATARFTKIITVYDLIAPEIVISGNVATEASVGEITLPSATVSDNNDKVELMVCVIRPDGKMITVKGFKFNAEKPGMYTVIYMVKDTSYSYCMKTFDINVKGA